MSGLVRVSMSKKLKLLMAGCWEVGCWLYNTVKTAGGSDKSIFIYSLI